MSFTGYSNSGKTYNIGSEKGMNFINGAGSGQVLTDTSDGSRWVKNSDGSTTITTKGGETFNVASALGNLQNTLDLITQQSDKSSARSLEYAQQNQEWSANQAAVARNFNAAEAAKNRDWQEYMSNTAHQREVADLKAAGLNPVLSAMGGQGAAIGSGAAASAGMPAGGQGTSDMSANNALVSILGSMLNAQTSLTNSALSARTQEAMAEKYTAMDYLIAELTTAASRYGADRSYDASHYSADRSYDASRYSADRHYDASKYSSDMQYIIARDFPDNAWNAIGSLISLIAGKTSGSSGKSNSSPFLPEKKEGESDSQYWSRVLHDERYKPGNDGRLDL